MTALRELAHARRQQAEQEHQLAYAERQWRNWALRVKHAQLRVDVALAKGDLKEAERALDASKNWLEHLDECNGTINGLRRSLSETGGVDE